MAKKNNFTSRLSNYLVYISVLAVGFIARRLSLRPALVMGSGIGNLVYAILKKRRNITLNNLRMVFKEKQDSEITEIAKQSFQNLGKTLIEFLRFPIYDSQQIKDMVHLEGEEYLKQAILSDSGFIIVTAHFGNWEFIFHVLAGMTDKLSAVAQRFKNQRLDKLTNSYRIIHGGEIIEKKLAIKQVLLHLRKGFCVVILSDQDAGDNGIFVDFLGMPASTAKGAVAFAMRTGATILNVFDVRQSDGSHVIKISEPMKIESSGDLQRDVREGVKGVTQTLEQMIYKYPSQWLWMHNRWKTKLPK
jgi:Kdo2-lipid IVA lauroyltransferase/acyltransferase